MMRAGSRWLTWCLFAVSAVLLAPLVPSVMLALWATELARVVYRPLTSLLRGRLRLAAALSALALIVVLVPFAVVVASIAIEAYDLLQTLASSPRGKELLQQLVASSGDHPPDLLALVLSQQERVWSVLVEIAGTATRWVIALFVIIVGVYALLVDGERWSYWLEAHLPIPNPLFRRLRDAFYETGRGLFIGIGGAGLIQGVIATVTYLALGIPHALELGLLTFCFSIVPAIGTAIVWVPVAAGLALSGRPAAALALLTCGFAVIGTVDNFVRPLFARRGHLQLPTYVVLIAMLAGVLSIGPWGLFVAPLAVRLTKAALEAPSSEAP